MANILSVTSGFPSLLYPSVELSRRLAAAGHRLTFMGLPEARGLVEHHGLTFLPLEANRYPEFMEKDAEASLLRRFLNLRRRRQEAQKSLAVGDFAQALKELNPDLILIDGEMHEHIIAASAAGIPLVLVNSFSSIWRRRGLPPAHCLVRPGVGWQGTRVGMGLLWFALRLRKWCRVATQRIRRVGCDRVSLLRQLAIGAGFDFRRETDSSQWLMPFTYRRFPVLSLHAQEFEFPHRPAARVHYVGPMLLESRIDRPMEGKDGERLEALFERHLRSQGERELIYAAFGSVLSADLEFLKRLLGIVEDRPHWDLVISLSGRISPADLGRIPERVHVFPWVPQRTVLRHTDVMVTHGGINTIDECVVEGVPMLIYCGFETDMAGNTARVMHHGIVIAGDRSRDSSVAMGRHIDRLLAEPGFKSRLMRLRQCYLAYGENGVAEQVIGTLIANRSAGS